MSLIAVNPSDGRELARYDELDAGQVEDALSRAQNAFVAWRERPVAERAALLDALATVLRNRAPDLARQASLEMGKPIRESLAEVEKSAVFCDYYAARAEELLAPRRIVGPAVENEVRYDPLGPLLAVMPGTSRTSRSSASRRRRSRPATSRCSSTPRTSPAARS